MPNRMFLKFYVTFEKTVEQLRLDLAQRPTAANITGWKNTSQTTLLAVLAIFNSLNIDKASIVNKNGSLTIPIQPPAPKSAKRVSTS